MDIRKLLGLPNVLEVKKVICVQPHPDDNEVGMAGTILELRKRGCEVVYITVTDGSAGSDGRCTPRQLVEIRRQEMADAANILGVSKQIELGMPDAGPYNEDDLFHELLKHFREEQPDVVFTVDPWMPYEAHPDHIKTGHIVVRAVLFAKNPVILPEYVPCAVPQIGFYHTSYPNTFVDVTEHWDRKMASVFAHQSQFGNAEGQLVGTYLKGQAQENYMQRYGLEQGTNGECGLAEAFKVLAVEQLHCFPNAIFS